MAMERRKVGRFMSWGMVLGLVGLFGLAVVGGAWSQAKITVTSLDDILRANPLAPGGPTAKVSGSSKTPTTELQVIEMSKIRLHHHEQEDHIVYVARGRGTARLGDETREVKSGDILNIPRGVPHGFTKTSEENLVLLVAATVGWKPLEDTKFHE